MRIMPKLLLYDNIFDWYFQYHPSNASLEFGMFLFVENEYFLFNIPGWID